ncbi:TusE/DsrC/DsvC family sulfur relay protein [Chloroflexota bacterium]
MTTEHDQPAVMPEFDEEGFLIDGEKWNKEIAEILAQKDVPQGLTEDHWKIVAFMRKYYRDFGTIPPVRILMRDTSFSIEHIYELFPHGFIKGACKVSGIPRYAAAIQGCAGA